MSKLNEDERNIFENAIYLPMVLTILDRDLKVAETAPFKLKQVYLNLIEHTMKQVQKDMRENNTKMYKNKWKLLKGESDEAFTEYNFYINGYHEVHRYFNYNLRNNTEKLLNYYFLHRHSD
ncbi:protein YhjD [Niallia nealsonii AAU1]|nr:protein YhjD [Niallia nealsonii AAU1]